MAMTLTGRFLHAQQDQVLLAAADKSDALVGYVTESSEMVTVPFVLGFEETLQERQVEPRHAAVGFVPAVYDLGFKLLRDLKQAHGAQLDVPDSENLGAGFTGSCHVYLKSMAILMITNTLTIVKALKPPCLLSKIAHVGAM
jgi:hypothetical protein